MIAGHSVYAIYQIQGRNIHPSNNVLATPGKNSPRHSLITCHGEALTYTGHRNIYCAFWTDTNLAQTVPNPKFKWAKIHRVATRYEN